MRNPILVVAIAFLFAACATASGRGDGAPATLEATASRDTPSYTPMTVRPRLINEADVQQALVREYPASLRDAGIGGVVELWLFVDATGKVGNTKVNKGSGSAELDEAALKVAAVMEFTPARNVDRIVPVWFAIPLTFRTQ
jgi:TonB family protein